MRNVNQAKYFFLVIGYVFVTVALTTVGFNSILSNGNLDSMSLKFCSRRNDNENSYKFQTKNTHHPK